MAFFPSPRFPIPAHLPHCLFWTRRQGMTKPQREAEGSAGRPLPASKLGSLHSCVVFLLSSPEEQILSRPGPQTVPSSPSLTSNSRCRTAASQLESPLAISQASRRPFQRKYIPHPAVTGPSARPRRGARMASLLLLPNASTPDIWVGGGLRGVLTRPLKSFWPSVGVSRPLKEKLGRLFSVAMTRKATPPVKSRALGAKAKTVPSQTVRI